MLGKKGLFIINRVSSNEEDLVNVSKRLYLIKNNISGKLSN